MNSINDKDEVPRRIADIYDRLSKVAEILRKSYANLAVKWGWLDKTFRRRSNFYRQCPYYEGLGACPSN